MTGRCDWLTDAALEDVPGACGPNDIGRRKIGGIRRHVELEGPRDRGSMRAAPVLHHLVPALHTRNQGEVLHAHRGGEVRVTWTQYECLTLNGHSLPVEGALGLSECRVEPNSWVWRPFVSWRTLAVQRERIGTARRASRPTNGEEKDDGDADDPGDE